MVPRSFFSPGLCSMTGESPIRPSGSVVVVEGERVDGISPKLARNYTRGCTRISQTDNVGNGLGS